MQAAIINPLKWFHFRASVNSGGAFGGGYGMNACYPVNSSKETVFLLTIANSSGDEITIDGKKYPTHSDGSCYAYLTAGTEHFVRMGTATTTTVYTYDAESEEWNSAVLPFSTSVAAHSLLLADSIGVKFYMELSDDLLTDDTAKMTFTVNGKETVIFNRNCAKWVGLLLVVIIQGNLLHHVILVNVRHINIWGKAFLALFNIAVFKEKHFHKSGAQ